MNTATIETRIRRNEDAEAAGLGSPFCEAEKRDGSLCLRPATGDTNYCRSHEENPHTNYAVSDQCAHESWDGRRCRNRVWPHGSICQRHAECRCDACQTGQNVPGERC